MRLYAYRLAKTLGIADVDGLLDELSCEQLAEWMAYERIEADEERRASLAAKAEASASNYKRRGR